MFSTKKYKINYTKTELLDNSKKLPLTKNKELEYKIRILMNLTEDEQSEKNRIRLLENKVDDRLKDVKFKFLNGFPEANISFVCIRDEMSENQSANYYPFNIIINIKTKDNNIDNNIKQHLLDCFKTSFEFINLVS